MTDEADEKKAKGPAKVVKSLDGKYYLEIKADGELLIKDMQNEHANLKEVAGKMAEALNYYRHINYSNRTIMNPATGNVGCEICIVDRGITAWIALSEFEALEKNEIK